VARQLGAGDQFGDYRIEDVAGRGGMGIVFRARQRRPDRTVAIKVIAPELAADRDFRARFEQESAMAAQIEHPNVIPVYEVGDEDGLLYIAMRYVDGVDLGGLLASRGPLTPVRAAHLVSEVAAALDAAHAHGLVHRDVKPGNILVATSDHVYLTDFGLSKQISDTRGLTATGMFVGTLDYIAPEQIEGRRVDARTDIYALGCVLYELLAGVVPFPRDSELPKLYAHVHDRPAALVGVPAPLADAIARAMSKRPADRFQSAGDFGRAVVAGAAGRTDHGTGRAVAAGDAAISDAQALTEVGSLASTETGRLMLTEPGERSPRDLDAPGAGRGAGRGIMRGPRRRWMAGGAATLVAAIGAAVAIALGSGGPTPTTTTTTTTTTTQPRPQPPSNRAILAPATVAPSVDECQQQLMFAVDGTAGPVKCSNGNVNAVAWRYYARNGHRLILSLGGFATPQQALAAMCKDGSSTIPLEQEAYQLAKTYYQWQFAVDPSTEYPSSC
jgi:tRNA A-37 threonylcarbamoyl transferase component Bud32